MKKTLLSIICLVIYIISIKAQILYGTTPNGGIDGGGTLNKFLPATNNLTVAKSIESVANFPYYANLIRANDGKLYGMTAYGGNSNFGVIFSFDPVSGTYKKLVDFDGANGALPKGSLIQADDGKLYGITSEGGSKGIGVIFSFDPLSSTYIKLKDFNKTNGSNPIGGLVQANDGKLYGMTTKGGNASDGVIFSFDPFSSTYTKLKDFDYVTGSTPYGSLIQAADNRLYGMTYSGGTSGNGVIFSIDPISFNFTKLKDLDVIDGAHPYGSLVQANDGKLYGITSGGGTGKVGVIFSFDALSSAYTKLHEFKSATGSSPTGSVIWGNDGKLYGTTDAGGSHGTGVIFSYTLTSSMYSKLKDFDTISGAYPLGSLLQLNNGKMYGLTSLGGRRGTGVIFSFDPTDSGYTSQYDFGTNPQGSNFSSALTQAGNGKLYGITSNGGSNGYGVIFSFDASASTYTKLKDFDYTDGANPYGKLIQAANSRLYGMTPFGGTNRYGVIFSYDPLSSTYTKLKDLEDTSGGNPFGALVQAKDGKLYGMTSIGGNGNGGVLFSFDPFSSTYTRLLDFNYTNGYNPNGSLIQASDGKLYGITEGGGSGGVGVIFSYDPISSVYTTLKNFDNINGARPNGSLLQASDGKLYGMTTQGGSAGRGVIFSYDLTSSIYTTLNNFDSTNGSVPWGDLMQASDGKLYGMTSRGGSSDLGVIFSFDPASSAYTKLKDYNGSNGAKPLYGSAFIEIKKPGNPPTVALIAPANNATYLSGGNVYLNAIASDADGTISKVEFYNDITLLYTVTDTPYSFKWEHVLRGNYALIAKATDNSGLVTISDTVHISVVPNTPPTVNIINPANGETFLKGATIHLQASASDPDGRIIRVKFYNGTTLLTTEYKEPYTFDWRIGRSGNYTISATATDNWGAITTSVPVNISVVPNQPPTVNIINPSNGQIFTSPATINFEASAQDADGRIVQVSFYNGTTLLTNSEHKAPYTYQWQNVPVGTYTITAVAKDNWSAETTSAPITVTIVSPAEPLVSSKPFSPDIKTGINDKVSLQLLPNPARNILNINTTGFRKNKLSTISVISASGIIFQTKQLNNLTPRINLDVSSLESGMYIIKIISGDKVMYRQFVKM